MKKVGIFIILAMALVLLVPAASASEISQYDSGFQVQNLSGTDANIVMTFYNPDGTVAAQASDIIPANGSKTYYPIDAVSAGFNGSAVISSDQSIAAIANVLGDGSGSSYSGFNSGAGEAFLPLTYRNYFNIDSWFNVQNTGSAATTVEVIYAGTGCTETANIQPGAAATFDQATNTCLPDGFVGAATVTSTDGGNIVATALQVAPNGLLAYNGFNSSSTHPVMPLTTSNHYLIQTGTQIQNTGTESTEVIVTYTPAGFGTACTETRTIAPGESSTFTLYAFTFDNQPTTTTCTMGERFVGGIEVTGNSTNQPLVGTVNQTDFGINGSSYNSFDPSAGTSTVVMPLIMEAYGIFTGYNVMNVGNATANVTCTYSGLDAAENDTATLAPGGVMNAVQVNTNWPANTSGGYVGSAVCTAESGSQLLGIVNQNDGRTPDVGDGWLTYEAFSQ